MPRHRGDRNAPRMKARGRVGVRYSSWADATWLALSLACSLAVSGTAAAQSAGAPPASRPPISTLQSAPVADEPAATLAQTPYAKAWKIDYRIILTGYKDNYIISGFSAGTEVKFQFSLKIRSVAEPHQPLLLLRLHAEIALEPLSALQSVRRFQLQPRAVLRVLQALRRRRLGARQGEAVHRQRAGRARARVQRPRRRRLTRLEPGLRLPELRRLLRRRCLRDAGAQGLAAPLHRRRVQPGHRRLSRLRRGDGGARLRSRPSVLVGGRRRRREVLPRQER